jgi:hypothetical protein
MKSMNKFKLIALTMALVGMLSPGVMANNVILEASLASTTVMTVDQTDLANLAAVNTLGSSAQDLKFSHLTINSNFGTGFRISFSSENSGEMVLRDLANTTYVGTDPSQKIPYNVAVLVEGGTSLGAGLTAPAIVGNAAGMSLATPQDLDFSGVATAATAGYQLNLNFVSAVQASLVGGLYRDTITVTIADI